MPRSIIDLHHIDLNASVLDTEAVESVNPHRHEFRLLDRVIYLNEDSYEGVGIFEVRDNQFWVKGHIPGRPLFPGVLQIEAAAQLCSIIASKIISSNKGKFFGFIGVDKVKFRQQVVPGDDLILLAKLLESRRVTRFTTQILVKEKIVFSGEIVGSHI